jgi:hypothetical protein
MANKYMIKCTTSLVIKEMPIRTTLSFHLTLVRMAIIKKKNAGKNAGEREYKLVQPPWKSVWRLLKILKLGLPYDPAIPLFGICLKQCKSIY